MIEYVAFLRGINISGKNKIPMSDLKSCFSELEYGDIKTYLNSGNIAFTAECCETSDIRNKIEKAIEERFGLRIPTIVIEKSELANAMEAAPSWWNTGDKAWYDNFIFILSEDSPEDICTMIGEPTEELERYFVYKNFIFWSFDRAKYQKCNWWKKTASVPIADKLTIRTANTIMKVL